MGDVEGVRGGPTAAWGERAPGRGRVGEAEDGAHEYRTPEELREGCLQQIRDAIGVLDGTATPEEIDDYKGFIVHLTHKVAAAHREGGQDVSPAESDAIQAIADTLGVAATD